MGIWQNVLGTIIKEVATRNRKNENVKTADPVVFTDMQKKLENVGNAPETANKSQADVLADFFKQVQEAKSENQANPNVETADKSVYEDMVQEIERLKAQVQEQGRAIPNVGQPSVKKYEQAWTNSNGGILEARSHPDMGAAKTTLRIPEKSVVNVIEYSENSINLDGKTSRFALVEINGQKGWILENYLNFN